MSSIEREAMRLQDGVGDSRPRGMGTVRFRIAAERDAKQVLSRAADVMKVISSKRSGWPQAEAWRNELPQWFVAACAPERNAEEAEAELERWRALTPEEQDADRQTSKWSLENWLYWMEP